MKTLGTLLAATLVLGACSEKAPSDPHLVKANELFGDNNFGAAAEEFAASLQANPNQDVSIWKKGAFCYMKAGNFDKAAQTLLKTVDLETTTAGKVDAYRNIAGIYLQGANQPDKAEPYFAAALKLDPKDEGTLTWLAELASQKGGARLQTAVAVPDQLDKAIGFYDQIIQLNPANVTAWANKRIAVTKYLTFLNLPPAKGADAGTQLDPAQRQAKMDALKVQLDESSKKLSTLMKAAKK
jgi:tetratricopeptide (TPR) repeat protein